MSHDCSCHSADHRLATTVSGLITRPLYSPGLILQDSDLTAAVDYTRDLSRLLFSTLFGCGVLCGLRVGLREDCGLTVSVAPGIALDGCGDPLQLPGPATIKLDERDGVLPAVGTNDPPKTKQFWVIACGKERRCERRALVCDDSLDDLSEATRARMATEISVTFEEPKCACGFDGTATDVPDEQTGRGGTGGGRALRSRLTDATGSPQQPAPVRRDYVAANDSPDCRADCGCGSACACGCCVVLGKAVWDEKYHWQVTHKGVRRFVRPQLIADPIEDEADKIDS